MPDPVMLGPFEPAVPCRFMETRPCVNVADVDPGQWTAEARAAWAPDYRDEPCPPGGCQRYPTREDTTDA